MSKIRTFLSLTLALYGANAFSGVGFDEKSKWTGFYVGGNAGYLWTANNVMDQKGLSAYASPIFFPNSLIIANSLDEIGTNRIFNSATGFIGGAQIGYDVEFVDGMILGIDADLDGVSQSSGTVTATRSLLTPLNSTYTATTVVTKKLNYLGLINGRLGILVAPKVLLYGSGAFAYGGASLNTSYSVVSTNNALLPIQQQKNADKVLAGWATGGGIEWLFAPAWSVKLEYLYYYLGPLHSELPLTQTLRTTPPLPYVQSVIYSTSDFTENVVRVGVNYRFG